MSYQFVRVLAIALVVAHVLMTGLLLAFVGATWLTDHEPEARRLNALLPRLRTQEAQIFRTNLEIGRMISRRGQVQVSESEAPVIRLGYSAKLQSLRTCVVQHNQIVEEYRHSNRALEERYPPVLLFIWRCVYFHPLSVRPVGCPAWPEQIESGDPSLLTHHAAPLPGAACSLVW